jgi:phospholipid/cholesterol/gamma-HCH transport system substrate-binding protein
MKLQKETRIGIIITLVLGLLIWGLNFLKGRNIFTASKQYYAVFNDIGGLQISSIVSSHGYNVGQVSDIEFLPGNINKIVVEISIEHKFKIPKNSVVEIYSTDFMGSKAVNLIVGTSNEIARQNDTLISRFDGDLNTLVSKKLMPLKDKTENLIVSIDSVTSIIRNTFTPETQRDIRMSIAALRDLIQTQKEKIAEILNHMESIAQNLENSNKSVTNIIKNLSDVSDSLAEANLKTTVTEANKVLVQTNEILLKINGGKGSLGQIVNNDSLYNSLEKTIKDLDALIVDMNQNPKRYVHFSVFGSKDKKSK